MTEKNNKNVEIYFYLDLVTYITLDKYFMLGGKSPLSNYYAKND